MDQTTTLHHDDPAAVIAGWKNRPAVLPSRGANAITVDVEDYFQVEAFFGVVDRASWPSRECRIERNVDRVLDLFARTGAHGTFFTLGWIAERFPNVVRRIVDAGHELASHGSEHRRADSQSRAEFSEDVRRAKQLLEDIGGAAVKGYRAPSFSVMRSNLWVMEALAEAGYQYSSSTHPIPHDNYGIPEAPRFPFHPLPNSKFQEIPVTTLNWLGRNWPCGGGGYFRLLPYPVSKTALANVARNDRRPFVFYFHPWEIDPEQPRFSNAPFKSRLRHYTNLHKMEAKLDKLLRAYRWDRMDKVFLEGGA